ncbi:MAG: hypothetical protein ACR2NN_13295 [Bryobacteraceae bacterium]
MHFHATTFSITTALLVAFACLVIYTRLKGWLESNIPILFYLAMIVYTNALQGEMPPWVYLGFGFALLLRFEFMSGGFTTFLKIGELGVLACLVYNCLGMILY